MWGEGGGWKVSTRKGKEPGSQTVFQTPLVVHRAKVSDPRSQLWMALAPSLSSEKLDVKDALWFMRSFEGWQWSVGPKSCRTAHLSYKTVSHKNKWTSAAVNKYRLEIRWRISNQ